MSDQIYDQGAAPATGPDVQALYNSFMHNFEPTDKQTVLVPGGGTLPQEMPDIHAGTLKPSLKASEQDCGPEPYKPQGKVGSPVQELEKLRQYERNLATQTLQTIGKADLSHFGQPSQEAQGVVRKFLEAPDKKTALKDLQPDFNRVIAGADSEFNRVEKRTMPAIDAAKQSYREANTQYNGTFFKAVEASENLPPDKKEAAKALFNKVAVDGAELPAKSTLAKTFGNQPEFMAHLDKLAASQKGVFRAEEALGQAGKPLVEAALEQDRSRIAYERAAQSAGDKTLARSIDAERQLLAQQTRDTLTAPKDLLASLK